MNKLNKNYFYFLSGRSKVKMNGQPFSIFKLEDMGFHFVSPAGFQHLGSFCSIIQRGKEFHVFHGFSAGVGAVDFTNSCSYDIWAIHKFHCLSDKNSYVYVLSKKEKQKLRRIFSNTKWQFIQSVVMEYIKNNFPDRIKQATDFVNSEIAFLRIQL